jgi:hypothetical protein
MPSSSSHRIYSDLFRLSDFVQQVAVSQGKNLLIDALREHFRQDTFYRYDTDAFGFPKVVDVTDLPPDIQETRTTRIFIGDIFRYDMRYLPSVTVRHGSTKSYEIGFNQNVLTTKYRTDLVVDGYGNRSYIRVPTHHCVAGGWDQSFEIVIAAQATPDREELSDIVSSYLMGVKRQDLYESGLFIKSVSLGAEKEEDFANDKIYSQSLTVDTFSEWRREIPISSNSIVEAINFCFQYGVLGEDTSNTITKVSENDVL